MAAERHRLLVAHRQTGDMIDVTDFSLSVLYQGRLCVRWAQ
jgi:hypothetical protein